MTGRRPRGAAVALLCAAAVLPGCGEDACTELSGSAGQGLSLAFDAVSVQHFTVGPSLVFKYTQGTTGFPAILSVNSAGAPFKAGMRLDFVGDQAAVGERAHPFGNAGRDMPDGQDFGAVEGGTLTLDAFSASEAEGNIGFRFAGGKSLRGQFCGGVSNVTE